MGVVGHHLSGLAHDVEQNALSRTALVSGNHMPVTENALHDTLEVIETAAPGIALVAFHDGRPLVSAHSAGAGVGEQVDQNIVGLQQEQIVRGCSQQALTFGASGPADGFHTFDSKRLDDGVDRHASVSSRRR